MRSIIYIVYSLETNTGRFVFCICYQGNRFHVLNLFGMHFSTDTTCYVTLLVGVGGIV